MPLLQRLPKISQLTTTWLIHHRYVFCHDLADCGRIVNLLVHADIDYVILITFFVKILNLQ